LLRSLGLATFSARDCYGRSAKADRPQAPPWMNPPLWKYPKPKLYACSERAFIFGQVHSPPARAQYSSRRGFGRSAVQFERKAPCPHSSSARQFRQRGGSPSPLSARLPRIRWRRWLERPGHGLSFFMNKFRRMGFIEYNGTIKVHASLLNVLLHDKPQIRQGPREYKQIH